MTLFAFAGKCGFFGASGLLNRAGPSAAEADAPAKPSAASRAVSARPVKPAPASHRNSRRVRPQNSPFLLILIPLIQIDKLVQIQQNHAVETQGLLLAHVVTRPHTRK